MKKIIILFFPIILKAQIAIGKDTVDGSGILDFPEGTTSGIILPWVTNSENMTPVTPGTLVFDLTTSKVKYYNGVWNELSDKTGLNPVISPGNDIAANGVIIGSSTSSATGVLVLESGDRALILPKVLDPATNVKSPAAGMICYDPGTKIMCVYNGSEWFFWK